MNGRSGMKRMVLAAGCAALAATAWTAPRWTVEQAKAWAAEHPWYCGVNYIPANAINYTAMWDKTSFSPDLIRRELKLMTDLGMNCVRVVLQYAVYADDPAYFLKTFDRFLAICDEAKIQVMPSFFDDCCFGENRDPVLGRQSEPLDGWYAWAWSPSPGLSMVSDPRAHGRLIAYVKDVMGRHKDDRRVFLWDLYNEPRAGKKSRTWPLLRKVCAAAREVNPSQPLSFQVWCGDKRMTDFALDQSDVVTFHCYKDAEKTEKLIEELKVGGRPLICTEWMCRPQQSTIRNCLPVFVKHGVGCLLWGLVNGKTQTNLPWGHRPEMLPYKGPWQHDIYRGDHTPYDPDEIELLKKTLAERNAR